jgi:predicted RNA binding protein with dsRBD fold (UPF0201 family)
MEIYMISTVNLVLPNGKPVKMVYGLHIPLTSGVEEKSIAWGWGSTRNRYLKGIESLCGELSDQGNIASTMSVEGSGIGDNVKKIIAWIAEKLKILAGMIKNFFEKVRIYLSGEKHNRILLFKDEAATKLKTLLDKKNNHDIVNSLKSKKLLAAYLNAKDFLAAASSSSFDKMFKEMITEFNRKVTPRSDNVVQEEDVKARFKDYQDAIGAPLIKMEGKNIDLINRGFSPSIIDLINNYDIFLKANTFIEKYMYELNQVITYINKLISSLGNKSLSESDHSNMNELSIYKSQVNLLSGIVSDLLQLNIIQAIPTIDRAIVSLHQLDIEQLLNKLPSFDK